MRLRAALTICVIALLVSFSAAATELKLATWNLEWLSNRQAELPADVQAKRPEDLELLRRYAGSLNADVVAVQEVDGRAIAEQVFPPEAYSIHLSRDHVVQRIGIVVRRGIHYTSNPDVTALDVTSGLRSG